MDTRTGIPRLKLDANEGRCVLDREQLARVLSPEVARRYPDASRLEKALADRFCVEPPSLIATAGADDAIDRAFRSLAGRDRAIVSLRPGFVEFLHASERCGAEYMTMYRRPGNPLDLEGFCGLIAEKKPGLAVLASPDNPGGTVICPEDLERISAACEAAGSVFLLDLTYLDFADDKDIFSRALDLPRVLMTGSFSKSRGLAGFRSGWALAGEDSVFLIRKLRSAGPPFSLSSPAIEASLLALAECEERYADFVRQVRNERIRIEKALQALGAETWSGQGNFVSAFVRDAPRFSAGLEKRGAAIRNWPKDPDAEGLVRITCPGEETEARLLLEILTSMEAS